jgi:hypothetical protein
LKIAFANLARDFMEDSAASKTAEKPTSEIVPRKRAITRD